MCILSYRQRQARRRCTQFYRILNEVPLPKVVKGDDPDIDEIVDPI